MRDLAFFIAAMICLSVPLGAQAVSDSFTVQLRIKDDTTPPTTPSNVVATPITTSQIDVTWDASTDNGILAGYKVFRDSTQVATTTLLTYSDTGLTASTTYTYFIKAYDDSGNVSSSSASVSTTTPQVTATTTDTSSISGGSYFTFSGANVTVSANDAIFRFSSDMYISYFLRWGQTNSYEMGFIQSGVYSHQHITQIPFLEPGKRYYYELVITDQYGRVARVVQDSFVSTPSAAPPFVPNVADLSAIINANNEVRLEWAAPTSPTYKVRLVGNPRFYPRHDADGYVVYEGNDTSTIDKKALLGRDRLYYTLFVIDEAGNRSSGALIFVNREDQFEETPTQIGTSSPAVTEPALRAFDQLRFWQHGSKKVFQGDVVELDAQTAFKVEMPVSDETAQYVVLTIGNDMSTASYFMRRDYEADLFEAVVPPLTASQYHVTVSSYSSVGELLEIVSGTLRTIAIEPTTGPFSFKMINAGLVFTSFFLLLLMLLLVRTVWRLGADN